LAAPGVTEALQGVALLVTEDPESLEEAMQLLASDATERARVGERGRIFARQFTWERAARSFAQVLDGLAGHERP
jgi:glycosyltransferase involved in cell wall biosynthesis